MAFPPQYNPMNYLIELVKSAQEWQRNASRDFGYYAANESGHEGLITPNAQAARDEHMQALMSRYVTGQLDPAVKQQLYSNAMQLAGTAYGAGATSAHVDEIFQRLKDSYLEGSVVRSEERHADAAKHQQTHEVMRPEGGYYGRSDPRDRERLVSGNFTAGNPVYSVGRPTSLPVSKKTWGGLYESINPDPSIGYGVIPLQEGTPELDAYYQNVVPYMQYHSARSAFVDGLKSQFNPWQQQ